MQLRAMPGLICRYRAAKCHTYAFRFTVTDCAGQSTQSGKYYFRVAASDAPPVITGGPWLAAGSWPMLPTSESGAFVLKQNYYVFWTFSDDYVSCAVCARTGRATARWAIRSGQRLLWARILRVRSMPIPCCRLRAWRREYQFILMWRIAPVREHPPRSIISRLLRRNR